MDMYFCPNCGQTFQADECIEEGELLRCPNCLKPRVLINGRILITIGMILLMLTMTITLPYVWLGGIVLAGALCMTGAVRVFRQRKAWKRQFSESNFECFDEIINGEYSDNSGYEEGKYDD